MYFAITIFQTFFNLRQAQLPNQGSRQISFHSSQMDVTQTSKVQSNAAQTNDNPSASAQITTTSPILPPEIWVKIFEFVPAQKRLVIPAVCRPWRSLFLKTPSCWRGIRLGRNANYSTATPSFHPANFFPLTHVEEIEFTPAVPTVMRKAKMFTDGYNRPVSCFLTDIPCTWLGLVLRHAFQLKKLDLSATYVDEEDEEAFRYVTGPRIFQALC